MRWTCTVVDPARGAAADVVVDAGGDAAVAVVAEQFAAALGRPGEAPQLYVDGVALDPATPARLSRLREGCVVSLDTPDGCVLPEPPGLVELRIVSGPGAGTVHRLTPGEYDVGADPRCAIPVAGAAIRALTVVVQRDGTCSLLPHGADAVQLGDRALDGADAVRLDGRAFDGARAWPAGAQLTVGACLLEWAAASPPDAAVSPSDDGVGLDYNRPPRLLPPVRETRFRLPTKPKESERRPLPIVMALVPLVFAVVMVLVRGQLFYLMFGVLSPVMLVSNYLTDRKHGRRSFRRRTAEWQEHVARIEADVAEALVAERRERRTTAPDAAEVLLVAAGPRHRLWERRRHDPDHLVLRVGTADLPSDVTVEDPEQDEHRRTRRETAADVPVTVPLRERGVVGLATRTPVGRGVARWLVGQVAALHSPRDVQLWLLTDAAGADEWDWVRWLPHARPVDGPDAAALVGNDDETVGRRVAELGALVAARHAALRQAGDATVLRQPDVVVVLDGARRLRQLPGVVQVLRDGPAVGVVALCLDADERLLPAECQAVVSEAPDGRLLVRQSREDAAADVRPEPVTRAWCGRVARGLAPVRDISDDGESAQLPASSRLLDVLGLEPPTAEAIATRWRLGGRSTAFVIGETADGPCVLDLVRDGPHALVAGTTGAGKSELLQTVVASLAVANRPDALTFVLVDYKGGSAFADCVHLPHTVGMVTDLDTHLVERALASLTAELRRREHLLAAAGAKDVDDYVRLRDADPALAPLPRLVLVIDEFASMVRDLPDFVTGLVNLAQRGRSLGIHLILATQRPSGVVSPEIRANTNLRIALRVTDAAESTDVLDAPDASRIAKSTPGRAFARLGHGSLVPFQTARIGGRRPGAPSAAAAPVWVQRSRWADVGRPQPVPPPVAVTDEDETDLAALVAAVRTAAESTAIGAPASPWLPALADRLTLAELPAPAPSARDLPVYGDAPAPSVGDLPAVGYGVEDLPAEQRQRAAVVDLASFGHLLVAGAPRSGRSQLLRTLAGALATAHSAADLHLYGLDCGNGALLPLAALPHCGAVVGRNETERGRRLLQRLGAEVARRQEVLAAGGFADISEQRASAADADRLPHVLLLLDRWEGFTPTLGEVDGGVLTDEVFRLLREGASTGVHLVVTGDRTLLTGRISTLADERLTLRLTDRADYALAGLSPKAMPDEVPAGRAFRADTGVELQVALLDGDPTGAAQAEALAAIAARANDRDRDLPRERRPLRVDVLPARLSYGDAAALLKESAPLQALVGVGGDDLAAVTADLAARPAFVVAGPPRSGRSTLLLAMATSLLETGTRLVLATPRPSPLRALSSHAGVLASYETVDVPRDLGDVLAAADGPVAVLVDDAELVRDCAAADLLRDVVRLGADRGQALVLAGNAEEICTGFSGWQVDAKRARHGALLSPQSVGDGDLLGVRLPRSAAGQPVHPGRALVHLGDGELLAVQVPLVD